MTDLERYQRLFERMSDEKKLKALIDYHHFVEEILRTKWFTVVRDLDVYQDVRDRICTLHGYSTESLP